MKRLAIYPGSFNPFTKGHQNILEKAERLFDEVIISVGVNFKKNIADTNGGSKERQAIESKVRTLKTQLPSKNIEGYTGFLTDFVREKEKEYDEVVVIRGLRNGHDYDYEYNMTRHLWDQHPKLNIIIIACDPVFSHVSSSAYRELESIRSGAGHHLLAIENK